MFEKHTCQASLRLFDLCIWYLYRSQDFLFFTFIFLLVMVYVMSNLSDLHDT